MCVIGEEAGLHWGRVRCTGDMGRVEEGGAVIFLGRQDRQVKRFGHRVSLDYIQQASWFLFCVMHGVISRKLIFACWHEDIRCVQYPYF